MINVKTFGFLLIGLVIGLIIGVSFGGMRSVDVSKYENQISTLQGKIDNLNSQILDLQSQINDLNSKLVDKDSQISSLNSQLKSKESQINSLKSQLQSKNNEINNLKRQISELQSRIEELEQVSCLSKYEQGTWNVVAEFSGKFEKNTETFIVPGDTLRITFTIKGSSKYGRFSFYLYKLGEEYYTESFLFYEPPLTETVFVYNLEPGEYYLKISCANLDSWQITVEAFVS